MYSGIVNGYRLLCVARIVLEQHRTTRVRKIENILSAIVADRFHLHVFWAF